MDFKNIFFKYSLEKLKQNNISDRVYVSPLIPEKKLKNATSCMGITGDNPILILIDDTLFKSGKGGACVTSEALYWKQPMERGSIKLNDIKQLETKFGVKNVIRVNEYIIELYYFNENELQPFIDFLSGVSWLEPAPVTILNKKVPDKYGRCGKCRGRGRIKCNKCKGNGRYVYHDWQTDAPIEEICDECGGGGLLDCPNPACEEGKIERVPQLISTLNSPRISDRASAVEILGLMEDTRAVEPLIQALSEDKAIEVRRDAVEALGLLGDNRAVEPLIQALLEDEYAVVRGRAAEALDRLGDKRATEALIQALDDSDPWVSKMAICALKRMHRG